MNLISSQRGVAVRLDPHPGHGVVEDLVVLDEAQTCRIKNSRIRRTSTLNTRHKQSEKHRPEL